MKKLLFLLLAIPGLLTCSIFAQSVSTFVPAGSGPDDFILKDSVGNLFVSGWQTGNVYHVTPAGVTTVYASGFSTVNGLAWDGQGNLVVCDPNGNGIYKVASDSTVSLFLSIPTPAGIVKDPLSDTLYFTQYQGNRLSKVAPDTSVTLLVQNNGLSGPLGMAWDGSNELLVANFNNPNVFRVSRDGNIALLAAFPFSGWLGFIAYHDGYIYGTAYQAQKVYRMDTLGNGQFVAGSLTGQLDGPAATARFNGPNGLAFSQGGDSLFISDFNVSSIRIITGLDSIGLVGLDPILLSNASIAPNPVEGQLRVEFSLKEGSDVQLKWMDVMGREVRRLELGSLEAGPQSHILESDGIAAGTYLLMIEAGAEQQAHRVVVRN